MIKDEFKRMWDFEVKPVARECVKLLPEMKAEDERLEAMAGSEEKTAAIAAAQEKYKNIDTYGMQIISGLISAVEHDLADNRMGMNSISYIGQVVGALNPANPTYWKNVWKDDFSSETAQNFRKLGELMQKLVKVM